MRKQYHFRPSENGYYAWDVDKLVEKAKHLKSAMVKLKDIQELDENYWYAGPDSNPTVRSIADHLRLIEEADLKYPVILSKDGRIMDGMHRVAKAYLLGHNSIKAVRFLTDIPPDYEDVTESDLPY